MLFRYLYIRAASFDDLRFKRLLTRQNFHRYLLALGVLVVTLHGVSTLFLEEDQFYFDQACLRPHSNLKPQNPETKWHNLLLITYNLVSITFCMLVMWRVRKEEKKLTTGPGALRNLASGPKVSYFYTDRVNIMHPKCFITVK